MMRVLTLPTMMMIRRMQRLRSVPHVMAHHAHCVNRIGLRIRDLLRRATVLFEGLKIRKLGFQFSVILGDYPRKQSHPRILMRRITPRLGRRKTVRMRFAERAELGNEIIPEYWQRLGLEVELGQLFYVDEVLRLLAMLQR